jgi:lysozyme
MKKNVLLISAILVLAATAVQALPRPNDDIHADSAGIALITRFEGMRLRAYKCPAGVWTIGFGHTGDVKPGQIIDAAEARRLLVLDLKRFEKHVAEKITERRLTQPQRNACLSFAFNCGYMIRGNLERRININDTEAVCELLMKYVHAAGKTLPGLVRRRTAECIEYRREEFLIIGTN